MNRARSAVLFGLYPAAVTVAFVLDEAVSNGVSLAAATRAIPTAVLVALLAVLVGGLITRHPGRGPLLGLAFVFTLLAGDGPLPLLFAAAVILLLYLDLRLGRRGRSLPWPDLNRGFTVLGVVAVVLIAVPAFTRPAVTIPDAPSPPSGGQGERPDIYLVLLDGFGRADILREHYAHDTSGFIGDLEARGFTVATNSRSNEATTGLALASMLNGRHLLDMGFTPTSSLEPKDVRPHLDNNLAFSLFRAAGYETIAVSSGYELVSLRSADRFIDTGQLNELEIELANQTILEPVFDAALGDIKSDQLRARALAMPGAVTSLAAEQAAAPQFVFVHVPVPHPPFILDGDCRPIRGGEPYYVLGADGVPRKTPERLAEETVMTAGQAGCSERLAVEIVDGIRAGAGDDAVLIVFSDHGPDTRLNWFAPQATPVRERVANFFAARAPGRPDLFPDDITLVNVLPRLAGAYLRVDLPLQPDVSYFKMPGVGLVDVETIAP